MGDKNGLETGSRETWTERKASSQYSYKYSFIASFLGTVGRKAKASSVVIIAQYKIPVHSKDIVHLGPEKKESAGLPCV